MANKNKILMMNMGEEKEGVIVVPITRQKKKKKLLTGGSASSRDRKSGTIINGSRRPKVGKIEGERTCSDILVHLHSEHITTEHTGTKGGDEVPFYIGRTTIIFEDYHLDTWTGTTTFPWSSNLLPNLSIT
jgi:hypothetical protein